MVEIAAATTSTGRDYLIFSKNFIEDMYGKMVNYALEDKKKFLKYCREQYKNSPDNKFKMNSEAWGLKWDNREEFFEEFYKKMTKMLDGYKVDPEIIYGDSVTCDTPILLKKNGHIEIMTIDMIGDSSGWKSYPQFKSEDNTLKNKERNDVDIYEVWTDKGWAKVKRVIRHFTQKEIYEVVTPNGYVKVTSDHSLLSKNGEQIKPKDCKIGTELMHHFPKLSTKVNKNESFDWNTLYETQLDAMNAYLLAYESGNECHIKYFDKKFSLCNEACDNNPIAIKQINKLGNITGYVYDLETEVGHFHAGVGQMIVKNTDSVFYNPKITSLETNEIQKDKKALEISIQLGKWSSCAICAILPTNMSQEYEKVLYPFIIITKKRYVGNLYENDPNKFKQKSMGIVLKRRDNATIVKIVCGGIVDQMLNKRSPEGALNFVRESLKKILSHKYTIDKFVISKTLKGNGMTKLERDHENAKPKPDRVYAYRERMVHVVLADRMADRDSGNRPQSNDRIPYVYIVKKGEIKLQGDRVEHIDYVLKNKIPIDYIFYITNQIMKPCIQFLELISDNPKKIFDEYIIDETTRRKGQKTIGSFFEKA